jgi:hypothetical protein
MKYTLVIILSLFIFSPNSHAEESWKDYGHYKLVSLGGLYECPLKVEYILDTSDRLVDVTVAVSDKTACAPFQITTDYTSFSSTSASFAATAVRTDVTIGWTSPGFDSRISSSISVTLYEDINSRKCIFGSSDITEKGSYSCLWGAWDCPVNEPGGLFPSI